MTIILLLTVFVATVSVAAQFCNNGDVRLVGGPYLNEGRVEVCINQVWGTVTDDLFSSVDARVVCRQLGYPVDDPGASTTTRCCAYYGQGSGPIFLDNVGCGGTESSLLQCSHSSLTSSDSHSEDVGVICPTCNPDHVIRLSNGLIPQEGNVEICFSGIWRSVCASSWDHKDAYVVCREMGYPATAAIAIHNAYFGEHPRPNISSVLCYGNESTLRDCSYTNTSFCSPTNTAGVRCQGDTIPDPPCFSSTIRLTGGEDANEGRVEVCSNGVWGTICRSGGYWDSNDATVVCRQLGYQNPRVFVYQSSSYFGQGNGPILFAGLTCDGTELGLIQCSSSYPYPVYCSHSSDVGVRCEEIAAAVIDACTDGEVRLMDGETAAEGRVEICINNIWGSVCDDGWDQLNAAVVCNQLGFQTPSAKGLSNAFYGEGQGPYHLDNVNCAGDESTLLECSHPTIGVHNCIPGMDAGVSCDVSDCDYGAVRLVDGATNYEGRLDVCIEGQWSTACDDGFSSISAGTVCRQLFGENITAQYFSSARFGQGSGSIISDVYCTGSESRLVDCPYTKLTMYTSAGCFHYEDVSIRCYSESNCNDGDIRFVDGEKELDGRVEVCKNHIWGAVTGLSGWTFQEAKVACIQLGYASEWAVPLTTSFFGRGTAPILIYYIRCSGEETALDDCLHYTLSPASTSYFTRPVVGVICQGNSTSEIECSPGDIRLAGGQTETEGRVEVCVDGFWGTVCEEGWDEEDALVFCRQSGLSTAAMSVTSGFFGEGSGPIISNVACSSRESTISQCGWEIGTADCHHGRDVGVRCQISPENQVKLVITSPQDEGPFQIGTAITLQCLVDPPLPLSNEITYTWTTSASTFPPQSSNSSFPNATVTIQAWHPQESQYYCHVYRRQFLLGVGDGSVKVQNLLYTIGNQVLQYTTTESVSLKINLTSTDIRYNFRGLSWFHNGMEVIPSERFVIRDFNKTLTISNTTVDDSGVYEVKFTGLLVHPYSKNCEQDVLALLRHYPIGTPAHFYLYTSIPELVIQDITETAVEFGFENNALSIKDSENISFTVQGKVHASIDETVSTKWYFNGGALRPGTTTGPLKRPLLSISQTMEIENANNLDVGYYEVALTINPYIHLVSHLECPLQYSSFVTSVIGISDIVLARDSIQIMHSDSTSVMEPTTQENTNTSSTANTSSVVGGAVGGVVAALVSVITIVIVCILWQKRRCRKSAGNTVPIPSTKKSPENPGNARYTSTTNDVVLGPNISYEEVAYPGEIIYDKVN